MIQGIKIKGFSNYWIFPTLGMVWSLFSNRWIGHKGKNEYWYVGLTDDDGEQHKFQLYRLIWMTVNGEIPENMQVNHISEDKSSNSIWNLNLMTPKENSNWGTREERRLANTDYKKIAEKLSKQVGAFLDGVLVFTFPSTAEAGRNGFDQSNVAKCCNGKLPHYKGYTWRYLN